MLGENNLPIKKKPDAKNISKNKEININFLYPNFLDKSDDAYWSVPQFLKWARFIKVGETGLIKKKGKKALAVLEKAVDEHAMGLHTTREVLDDIFDEEIGWNFEAVVDMEH